MNKDFRFYIGLIFVLLLGRLTWILEPFGVSVDESSYMAITEAWKYYGKLYINAIERKPPLLFAFYRLSADLFGPWNIHGLHFLYFLLTICLCLTLKAIAGRVAALTYAFVSASFTREFISSNSEIPMMVLLGFSFFILLRLPKNASSRELFVKLLASAALAALATLFKQIAALPYACGVIFLGIAWLKERNFKKCCLLISAVFIGVGVIYSLLVVWLKREGVWNDFLNWVVFDNLNYIQDTSHLDKAEHARPWLSPLLIALGSWPLLTWALMRSWRRLKAPVLNGATLGAYLIIPVAGRLYSHYFVALSWFLILLLSQELSFLLRDSRFRLLARSLLISSFSIFFVLTTFRDQSFAWIRPGVKAHAFDLLTQKKIEGVSRYIKKNTNIRERISVWGMASQIYVESERGSATRFIYADPVSGRLAGFSSPISRPIPGAMDLYLEDLDKKKPSLFIDTSSAQLNDYQYFQLEHYPPLVQFLNEHYAYVGDVEGFGIWSLKFAT